MCDELTVNRLEVKFTPPPRQVTSGMLMQKLEAYVVNPVVRVCNVVAIACKFHTNSYGDTCRQMSARRRQIELSLLQQREVCFYSCLLICILR